MLRLYSSLTKFSIVIFLLLAGLAGYLMSFSFESKFDWLHLLSFIGGLYFLSSGSLTLNQVQEWRKDFRMLRTKSRPIPSGKIKPTTAGLFAFSYLLVGTHLLFGVSQLSGILGLMTIFLYNGLYVYWWKPKWIFAAIPGALAGALPVTIGYAANSSQIFSVNSIYLFLLLFFWQAPHFWILAIKFCQDYEQGGFPVLPSILGIKKTIYHIGIWILLYLGTALVSPLFTQVSWFFLVLLIPLSLKVLHDFRLFLKSNGTQRMRSFYLWLIFSLLIFLYTPVLNQWFF